VLQEEDHSTLHSIRNFMLVEFWRFDLWQGTYSEDKDPRYPTREPSDAGLGTT
jgi:hypothetical protein